MDPSGPASGPERSAKPPSRALLIASGALTQLIGTACLVLALASLPVVHDLHHGMQSVIASVISALAAIVCGTLAYRGRLVPLALAAGIDVGFGIVLPRGGSAIGVLLRILPADDASTAEGIITAAAVIMFATAALCLVAIPTAVKLRRWAFEQISSASLPAARTTLPGIGAVRLSPTQIVYTPKAPLRSRVLVIGGVAVTVVALGVIVISAVTGPRASGLGPPEKGSAAGSATTKIAISAPGSGSDDARRPTPDARRPEVPAQPPSFDDTITAFHDALAHGKADAFAAVLDAKAFAFGVEGHELAEGRDAIVALLRHDVGDVPARGLDVAARFQQSGHEGDAAWLAEEVRVGTRTFVVTAIAGLHDNKWSIAALSFTQAMPNETAYKLARDGELVVPDAIPDRHDDSPLAAAMRTAFASKPSFVEARSTRADGFNFGSAPGERITGGDSVKKTFARLRATIRLHDATLVGMVGERAGWGAANVDFTDADRDGTQVTQTFRVLAIWLKEDAGWRIVQTQWSNAR
jgi:hypothetical protein